MIYEGVESWVVEILRKEEEKAITSRSPLAAAFWRSYQLKSYGLIRDEEALSQQDFETDCSD